MNRGVMTMTMETLGAAYVRGFAMRTGAPSMPEALGDKPLDALTDGETALLLAIGREAGLKMHRMERREELPRVRRAMSFLRGVQPESLLDVGSGRGLFLFPFLCAFPFAPVTSVDIEAERAEFIGDIRRGGVERLTAMRMDICGGGLPEKSFDVVTMLEVLEHIPDVQTAVCSAVRLARRYVVVTVPSKPDNNPEHIHLLTKARLTQLFGEAGCTRLQFDGVPGHLFMVASVKS